MSITVVKSRELELAADARALPGSARVSAVIAGAASSTSFTSTSADTRASGDSTVGVAVPGARVDGAQASPSRKHVSAVKRLR